MEEVNFNNENEYLESMNRLKDKFDQNEELVKQALVDKDKLRKHLITAYGLIRLIDNGFDDEMGGLIGQTSILIEALRGYLSDAIENDVLKINSD